MNIGIIGAGNIGSALARHFCKLQHTVQIVNSRGPETLSKVAEATGAIPVAISEAVRGVDLLIITIPMKAVPSLPEDLLHELPAGSPVIDTGNYYPLRDGFIDGIGAGMTESEWTSSLLGRPVIKAFNNIISDSLIQGGLPKGSKSRIALPVTGDDTKAKRFVIELLDNMGFDGFDAGPLSQSWRHEPGTPAYCSDPTLKELPSLLQRADRKNAAGNRDQAARILSKLPADFPAQELVRASRFLVGLDVLKPRSWFAMVRLGLAMLRPAQS
jgi:8-hydroxy-5-deazaflavin:NADPH oxidoreductase